jgi:hypothetical protein
MTTDVEFVEDLFPLLIVLGPPHGFDEHQVNVMAAYYERLWKRDVRYALVSHTRKHAKDTSAHGRKLIVSWANSPRVRAMSTKYCVGSTTVVPNALARGALTAILWLWTPAAPHEACSSPEQAIDWCLKQLADARMKLPYPPEEMRRRALAILRESDRG